MKSDPNLLFSLVTEAITTNAIPAVVKTRTIDIKCNVCGDSADNHRLKRGGFYFYDNALLYHCFNDGCDAFEKAWSADRWLKTFSPSLYRRYQGDSFNRSKTSSQSYSFVKKKDEPKESEVDLSTIKFCNERKRRKPKVPKIDVSEFIKITAKHELASKARAEVIRRKIPKEFAMKFKVGVKGKYYGRMIIPFFDADQSVYIFSGKGSGWILSKISES